MKTLHASLQLLVAVGLPAFLQAAPFKNLGFDQPEYPPDVPNPFPNGPFGSDIGEWVVPGWRMSPQSAVGYNVTQPFAGIASLLDADFRDTHFGLNAKRPVVGDYSLAIWPGNGRVDPGAPTFPFVLRQTGDIPDDAQSLRFLYYGSDLRVLVGGVEQDIHRLEDQPSGDPELTAFHYYAVDVSPFAGQTAALRFEFVSRGYDDFGEIPRRPFEPNAQMHVLDDLSFSPLPAVPEPQPWVLLGTGLAAVYWLTRRK